MPKFAVIRQDHTFVDLQGVTIHWYSWMPGKPKAIVLIVHGVGSIATTRSHFDAQHFMEIGMPGTSSLDTGWLGRHLASRPPMRAGTTLRGVAMSFSLTEMLRGGPNALPVPDATNFGLSGTSSTRTQRLNWLNASYAVETDPMRTAAQATQQTINTLTALNIGAYQPAGGAVYANNSFARALRSAAALIRGDIGVEVIQIDLSGWDTHSAQGPLTGGMATNMRTFADALGAFHADMDGASKLGRVTLVAMSEFGRRAAENGSAGTDHGHGGVMFVMGGGTNGGQVMANWPGLASGQLYQGQDVQVTIDHRDILADVVMKRLGNTNLDYVFPEFTYTNRNAVHP